jgi:hypothetical protein
MEFSDENAPQLGWSQTVKIPASSDQLLHTKRHGFDLDTAIIHYDGGSYYPVTIMLEGYMRKQDGTVSKRRAHKLWPYTELPPPGLQELIDKYWPSWLRRDDDEDA